jgi:tRNA threonylcarbamoyladenosine biosynthesis protein TsaB
VLVLSLDTTTRAGSVAVVRGDEVLSQIVGDPSRTHGERLPRDLERAIETASVTMGDVELLAVMAGPGSFTGLRIGIAAMQGLASALGLRIFAASALDALALVAANDRDPIATWIDAQRGEVFAALYDPAAGHTLISASSLSPMRTLETWGSAATAPVRFIGDGAVRYRNVIHERLGSQATIIEPPALAPVIGLMASRAPEHAVTPHAVVPIYIRKPDAELARIKGPGAQGEQGARGPKSQVAGSE